MSYGNIFHTQGRTVNGPHDTVHEREKWLFVGLLTRTEGRKKEFNTVGTEENKLGSQGRDRETECNVAGDVRAEGNAAGIAEWRKRNSARRKTSSGRRDHETEGIAVGEM